jgi:hypothetical protein
MVELRGLRQLTDVLLEPVSLMLDFHAVVQPLPQQLAALAVPRPGGGAFRVTDHQVRTSLSTGESPSTSTPFRWSAATARRAIGLSAVRALVTGDVRSPAQGVRAVMATAGKVSQGERPTSSMDAWLASLSAPARAAVAADGITWATRLWTALDWTAFPEPPMIGRDHWWDSPHSSLLAVRSRAEVRAIVAEQGDPGNPVSVHLVVLGGPRRATVRSELCVVALVESLLARNGPIPGRVVGWWPDSGHFLAVTVDRDALREGVKSVAQALAATGVDPRSTRGQSEAVA